LRRKQPDPTALTGPPFAVRGNDAASVSCVEEKEMAQVIVTRSSSRETDRFVTVILGKL
jgi:hypothetical protein